MRRAVYAGSFDPMTNGHIWMVERGSELFDELIVAVGDNPDKKYHFSHQFRCEMLKMCVAHLPNVKVMDFSQRFLVNFSAEQNVQYILRGIRNFRDYEYERGMRHINGDICPNIQTLFLIPPREIAEISSRFVNGLVGPEGWQELLARYVPNPIYQLLLDSYQAKL